jgi:hypothetical protein
MSDEEKIEVEQPTEQVEKQTPAAPPAQMPTVGRVVHFYETGNTYGKHEFDAAQSQPQAAVVAFVWTETGINIGGFDSAGVPFSRTSVPHRSIAQGCSMFWDWPPRV